MGVAKCVCCCRRMSRTGTSNRWWDSRCGRGYSARRCGGARRRTSRSCWPVSACRWSRPASCRLECGYDRACGGDRWRRSDGADVGGRVGVGGRRRCHRRAARQPGPRRLARRRSALTHHRSPRSAWNRRSVPIAGAGGSGRGVRLDPLGHQRLSHPALLRAGAVAEPHRAHTGQLGRRAGGADLSRTRGDGFRAGRHRRRRRGLRRPVVADGISRRVRRRTQSDPEGRRHRVPGVGSDNELPDRRGRDGRGAGVGPPPRRARDPFLEQDGGWGSSETLRHSFETAQRRERMGCYVLGFQEIDQTQVAVVGGKGAHLGELSRIEGLRVPAGFCVTTDAFQRIMAEAPSIDDRLDRLSRLKPDDREAIRAQSAEIRRSLEAIAIPDELAAAITGALARLGEQAACAVRSSATAEDLPTASFAGQQDTYLNVVGPVAILQHVSRCWASLFTERAVIYRLRNGLNHRKVHMAVVVQRMVFPQAAGILFTADPITGNRKVASVEASFGLGEALVSGLLNADVYKVRDGEVLAKAVATKRLAIHASPAGGTQKQAIEPERQEQPALTDAQVVRLAQLGRRIEAHFGCPQDIEWCLVDDGFQIVQSRPITTLFPIPEVGDGENPVYVSVGHGQMMTDPMKPLGLSGWQLTTPRPMNEAGGRLFVDVTQLLASPASRAGLLGALGKSDPLIGDALQTILDRGDFIPPLPNEGPAWSPPGAGSAAIETDPAIVAELIGRSQASIAALKRDIPTKSGSALLDFILADIQELRRILF